MLSFPASPGLADEALPLPLEDARRLWMSRLDGQHFTARMTLRIDQSGTIDQRVLRVWRDDEDASRERILARFEEPADMRGFSLLYLENHDRPNDYFIYQPWSRRVRRVPESIVRQDIYGVDLEYLGFGLALVEPTEVESVSEQRVDGASVVRITETALEANQRFDRRVVWLDPATWVPIKTEHLRNGRRRLVATTEEVRLVQGIPTPVRVLFDRPEFNQRVLMTVDEIDYLAPIPEAFFSTFRLLKEH